MRIVVIGAGLIGLSTAYFLGRAGHEVIVLDRREGPALETSFANGGMVTPSQAEPWNTPGIFFKLLGWLGREDAPVLLRPGAIPSMFGWGLAFLRNSSRRRFLENAARNARLASYSLGVLKELRARHGVVYDAFQAGTLKLYRDAHELQEAADSDLLRQSHITFEVLDRNGVRAREPALAPITDRLAGGIYFSDDESGDAYQYCRALAERAAENGVAFRYGVSAIEFRAQAGRVVALETSAGALQADCFVLAGGSHSPALAKSLDIALPVQPVKGYSLTIEAPGWHDFPRVPVIDDHFHIAVTPLAGTLRVAGTAEFSGYDARLTRKRLDNLWRFAMEVYPGAERHASREQSREWSGFRPYSCDGVPIIGRTRFDNLYLNTGHGHLGWTMAAGSGKLLADLVSGVEPAVDPRAYRPDRF